MKACPYCAEQIQEEAVLCRFCQRNISTEALQRIRIRRTNLIALIWIVGLLVAVFVLAVLIDPR